MAEKVGRGKGKKGRKNGRTKRKPCQVRYTLSRRWEQNKLRRAKKYAKKHGCTVYVKIENTLAAVRPA